MKIFEKRPLALILCIMLGGFSFFVDLPSVTNIFIALVSLATIGLIFIFKNLEHGRRIIIIICIIAFSLSLSMAALWSFVFYPTEHYDKDISITARVYDIDNSDSNISVITCKTEEINSERDKHKIIVYADKSLGVYIRKYDVISFNAELSELQRSDDGFNGRSYYLSKGYSAVAYNMSDLKIICNKKDHIDNFFSSLNLSLSNKLKLRTDYETGSFLSALIIGNRDDLSGNTRQNFARLGISHILALSGMHLAILSVAIHEVLKRLCINKKVRVSILSVFIIFYIALTGFSASVLRSGIMLLISGSLFLLTKGYDAITSLVISVFLIVTINPVSVYDLSLWLSAFATLGVIVFSSVASKTDKNDGWLKKTYVAFINGCMVSVFAFCATFIFTALRFDSFSILSVFTTLIFSFVIQVLIYAGIIILLVGGIIPIGKPVVFISNLILSFAEWISSFKFVYVSMNSVFVKVLIVLLTLFFFSLLVFEVKNKKRGIIVTVALLISVFVVAEIDAVVYRYNDDCIYAPSQSGDTLIIKDKGDLTAIYSGKAFEDNSWDIIDLFADEGITFVDNLVYTGYSYSSIAFTKNIIDSIKVEQIHLPRPTTKDEINQAEGISDLLSKYGTRLTFYETKEIINLGKYKYRMWEKVDYTYGKYPANIFEIINNDESFTYLSVCEYELLSPSAKHLLLNSKNLVIGSIGNTNYYLFDMLLPEIESIYYFDEGRLTDGTIDYYKNKGASMHCIKTPISIFD